MKSILFFTAPFVLVSCSTILADEVDVAQTPFVAEEESVPTLVINEYAPKSDNQNEFGEKEDWIELYNASSEELIIQNGDWMLTDSEGEENGFILPDTILKPGDHLLIWCDKNDCTKDFWHAPFKLSGEKENLSLYFKNELVDEVSYDHSKKGESFGRQKDGDLAWENFKDPTPGKSNELLENYAEARH